MSRLGNKQPAPPPANTTAQAKTPLETRLKQQPIGLGRQHGYATQHDSIQNHHTTPPVPKRKLTSSAPHKRHRPDDMPHQPAAVMQNWPLQSAASQVATMTPFWVVLDLHIRIEGEKNSTSSIYVVVLRG